jgi:hypothetical protein
MLSILTTSRCFIHTGDRLEGEIVAASPVKTARPMSRVCQAYRCPSALLHLELEPFIEQRLQVTRLLPLRHDGIKFTMQHLIILAHSPGEIFFR